jgi:hypothetical protein
MMAFSALILLIFSKKSSNIFQYFFMSNVIRQCQDKCCLNLS